MVVMMDIEISCKGHCEKSSHFLDHVSHTGYTGFILLCYYFILHSESILTVVMVILQKNNLMKFCYHFSIFRDIFSGYAD